MVAEEVLALLRCPETMQPLAPAAAEVIAHLETARVAGRLRDRAGNPCDLPVEAGLVRADGTLFFPIRDGIPILITAEAILLSPPNSPSPSEAAAYGTSGKPVSSGEPSS